MKRFRFMPKLAAAIVSAAMIFSGAVPAFAAEGTTSNFDNVFTVYLGLNAGAPVPNKTIRYTTDNVSKPANATAPDLGTLTATFSSTDSPKKVSDLSDTESELKKKLNALNRVNYAKADVSVNWSEKAFNKAGVYKYKITEQDLRESKTFNNDPSTVRYLDVYVDASESNGEYTYSVAGTVFHNNSTDTVNDNNEMENKSLGYFDSYNSVDLKFEKKISGNQVDTEDKFSFNLSLENLEKNANYSITVTGTSNTTDTFNSGTGGTYTREGLQLGAGDQIELKGLPKGVKYTFTETDSKGYTPSYPAPDSSNTVKSVGDTATTPTATNFTITDDSVDQNTTSVIVNTKEGTVPTGVIFAVAPFAIGAVAIAAFVILKVRKAAKQ